MRKLSERFAANQPQLVKNAAKYAPPDTDITLEVRRVSGAQAIPVRDRGLGVGLAIVRGLLEAHGRRVWIENRPGGGAQFTFTLPVSTAAAPEQPPAPEASVA